MKKIKITLIGGGNMAEAIVKGLIRAGQPASGITVSEPSKEKRERFRSTFGITVTADNAKAAGWADVIVLAVKPGMMLRVCEGIRKKTSGKLVVSVAAGIRCADLLAVLGSKTRLVRVMPNTPALIGEGMTAASGAGAASEEDVGLVIDIFQTLGRTVRTTEDLLDAVTGLSGSGPAYVFLMIEALADGGVQAGLPRADADLLAAQTVLGAARLVLETGTHPAVLKDRVASPGGTTIEGLNVLERAGVRGILMDAVTAAARKSRSLGERKTAPARKRG